MIILAINIMRNNIARKCEIHCLHSSDYVYWINMFPRFYVFTALLETGYNRPVILNISNSLII